MNDTQLTSPINGTIASVGMTVGDTVSAGSSTSVFVIIGTQSYQVTGTLTSTQVQSVKVGYPAQVVVDGTTGTSGGNGRGGWTRPIEFVGLHLPGRRCLADIGQRSVRRFDRERIHPDE